MMGGFQLLMTLLAIIGSRFGDAGLRDVAVQSEVIAEGSIDSVLSGKHYISYLYTTLKVPCVRMNLNC